MIGAWLWICESWPTWVYTRGSDRSPCNFSGPDHPGRNMFLFPNILTPRDVSNYQILSCDQSAIPTMVSVQLKILHSFCPIGSSFVFNQPLQFNLFPASISNNIHSFRPIVTLITSGSLSSHQEACVILLLPNMRQFNPDIVQDIREWAE
jgi:hypothetical protein